MTQEDLVQGPLQAGSPLGTPRAATRREDGWTVVLRRQAARIVEGRPEGGYTDAYEIVCCDCGDHPDLDYSEVSPELRRVRGPYPVADGIAAYVEHVGLHDQSAHPASMGRERMPAD